MTRKQFFKMNKRTATIMLALMLTTSTLTACGKKNEPSTNNPAPTVGADNQAETNGKFKAGVYTAKVMGMHDMTVTVTVSADKIEDIELEHEETPGIGAPVPALFAGPVFTG